MVTFSLFIPPTPVGVPVMIRVPRHNVIPYEKELMSFGVEKIKSLVPQCSRTSPFFKPLTRNLEGSGINSGETSTGPIGQALSKPLEKLH